MKLNKTRPKFHLLLTKIEKKFTLCFCFVEILSCNYNSKPKTSIKRLQKQRANKQLITKQKHYKVSHFYLYFCQKMEFRTCFVTFPYIKLQRTRPTESGPPLFKRQSYQLFSPKPRTIDLVKVFDAILTSRERREKLQCHGCMRI